MPFLDLNGWQIKVMRGGQTEPIIIGDDDGRAFSGRALRDRRIILQRDTYQSTFRSQVEAHALVQLLLGEGHDWPFDVDLFSGKGLGPEGSTAANIRPGIAADLARVFDGVTGITESQFGAGSIINEPSKDNLLTADSRNAENAPTGYAIEGGGTLGFSTVEFFQGLKSVTGDCATGQGVGADDVSASSATEYTASVYVRAAEALPVILSLFDDDIGELAGSTSVTTIADGWIRIETTGTTGASATTIRPRVLFGTVTGTKIMILDAWQLVTGPISGTWFDGTRPAANDLCYPKELLRVMKNRGFTFAAWVRGPTANPAAATTIFEGGQTLLNRIGLQRDGATNNLKVTARDSAGVFATFNKPSVWDDDWHHVAVVSIPKRDDGTNEIRLYLDGVNEGGITSLGVPDFTAADVLEIGNRTGAFRWPGLIDEVIVAPYAMVSDQIAALAAQTAALPSLPILKAEGDFFHAESLEVQGRVPLRSFEPITLAGSHDNNAGRVSFELGSEP